MVTSEQLQLQQQRRLITTVPPKSVHIMDLKGRSLEQIYGPLSESSNLTLVCISKGGKFESICILHHFTVIQ